jgi:hypothetical protein
MPPGRNAKQPSDGRNPRLLQTAARPPHGGVPARGRNSSRAWTCPRGRKSPVAGRSLLARFIWLSEGPATGRVWRIILTLSEGL